MSDTDWKSREEYMQSLRQWLLDTKDEELEEMSDFFTKRLSGYEEHMRVWDKAYIKFAELLPEDYSRILDLGCGTGLELDEIWKRNSEVSVTGVDLCESMLSKLREKHTDKNLELYCEDYFHFSFGKERWDAVISFESLHHFFPDDKLKLYQKVCQSLKEGGMFLLGDYFACCDEEEKLLRGVYQEKRKRSTLPEENYVHFDIPLTVEHEISTLKQAGFEQVEIIECEGVTILLSRR